MHRICVKGMKSQLKCVIKEKEKFELGKKGNNINRKKYVKVWKPNQVPFHTYYFRKPVYWYNGDNDNNNNNIINITIIIMKIR